MLGIIVGALIGAIFTGLIIWIIGKLGLGIEVDGFRTAYVAAVIIALLNAVAQWIWGLLNFELSAGLSGAITSAIMTAGFLVFAGDRLEGLRVKGFVGALLAALIMAAVGYATGALLVGAL